MSTTIIGDKFTFYLSRIRLLMRDRADNNILLDDVEFSPQDVEAAMCMAISQLNTMPPITNFTIDNTPEYLLILGTCRWLAFSNTWLQARNQLTFSSDDNEVIGIDDKFPLYMQLQNDLRNEWSLASGEYKKSINAESGYGALESGYANVTRFNS